MAKSAKKKQPKLVSKWVFQRKTKKTTKQKPIIKLPEDCNNIQLLSKIFDFIDFKNLLKFSFVCKKWNNIINPLINKRVRLLRPNYIQNEYHDGDLTKDEQFSAEIRECILTKGKHSKFIKEFKLNKKISVDLSIDFFTTFCYLTSLQVDNIRLSQNLLISCLQPLEKLETLELSKIKIYEIENEALEIKLAKLPNTLKKLYLTEVQFFGSPNLILETLNSHKNLKEFRIEVTNIPDLLIPLKVNYPSLKKLLLCDGCYQGFISSANEIVESNPQLIELEIHSISISKELMESVNLKLVNLKTLTLNRILTTYSDHATSFKFTQPTQLSKLAIYWYGLDPNSIDSILTQSPMINDLQIQLGSNFNQLTSIVRDRCRNLTRLTYDTIQVNSLGFRETLSLTKFFDTEFIDQKYPNADKLTSLNLGNFNILSLQPSHIEQFPNLNIIQFDNFDSKFNQNNLKQVKDQFGRFKGWRLKLKTYSKYLSGYLIKDSHKSKPFNWEFFHYWNQ